MEKSVLLEKDATRAIAFTYETMRAEQKEARAAELKVKAFAMGDKTMRWLRLPEGTAVKDQKIIAEVDGRMIRLTGDVPTGTQILLSDKLLGLDEPVEISINGKAPFTAKPVPTLGTIRSALEERLDPAATPTAVITCP